MTDYKELIERLRDDTARHDDESRRLCNQAADAIEALQAENERLREMYAGLKKMIDDGSIHERTYSAGIELERRNAELQAKLDELQRQEPAGYVGAGYLVLGEGRISEYATDVYKVPVYAAPKALEPNTCTCPSGDGSLRWPCPQHPPEEESGADCTPNHNCNGRMVHLPDDEHCDHCGITKGTPT